MAFRKFKRGGRKAGRKGRGRRPGGMGRPRAGPRVRHHQMATITETIKGTNINANQLYGCVFSLDQFKRASVIAGNFKWYKPTKVVWSYEPLFNTFQEGSAVVAPSVPFMYKLMNRTQDSFNYNLDDLRACGSQPKKFTSVARVGYTPNWCAPGLISYMTNSVTMDINSISQNGLEEKYAWLQTPPADSYLVPSLSHPINSDGNPASPAPVATNTVVFNGHVVYFDQVLTNPAPSQIASITCTVTWAFKDPQETSGVSLGGLDALSGQQLLPPALAPLAGASAPTVATPIALSI